MKEAADVQRLDHTRQRGIVAVYAPRPQHIQRHGKFQLVERDGAVPAPVQFSRSTSGNLEVTTERRRKAQAGAPTYRRRCRRGKARAVTKGSRLPRLSALCRDLGLKSRLTPSLHCPN